MNKLLMTLFGRSGCEISLIKKNDKYLVRKKSKNTEFNKRLIDQATKQNNYWRMPIFESIFKTPEVYYINEGSSNTLAYFDMSYIPGLSFTDYFDLVTKSKIDAFVSDIILLIEREIGSSKGMLTDYTAIRLKIKELKNIIKKQYGVGHNFYYNITAMEKSIDNFNTPLPVGYCHGDLTLSNMIFSNGNIYLIDFLDSFIDSPIIDMVKLRQDTKYYWSLKLTNKENDNNYLNGKIMQVLKYIDIRLHQKFSEYKFYKSWYIFFEKLNLLRIVPYLNNPVEISFIKNCLTK